MSLDMYITLYADDDAATYAYDDDKLMLSIFSLGPRQYREEWYRRIYVRYSIVC